MISHFLDWLYPPRCVACGVFLPLNEAERFVCVRCKGLFEPIAAPACARCGAPAKSETGKCASCLGKTFLFEKNIAAFVYDDVFRQIINEMKFGGKRRMAEGLGQIWAGALNAASNFPDNFSLVPMPMHRKKQRERGFNQAEILTRGISGKLSLPINNILIRTFDTPPQSEIHPSQRAENVAGVFSVSPGCDVRGKNYILTDDIFTTGASLNECAKTLKNAGAARIFCMTLCISVKNNRKP